MGSTATVEREGGHKWANGKYPHIYKVANTQIRSYSVTRLKAIGVGVAGAGWGGEKMMDLQE